MISNYIEIYIAKYASDIDLVRVGKGGNLYKKDYNTQKLLAKREIFSRFED